MRSFGELGITGLRELVAQYPPIAHTTASMALGSTAAVTEWVVMIRWGSTPAAANDGAQHIGRRAAEPFLDTRADLVRQLRPVDPEGGVLLDAGHAHILCGGRADLQ
ncbi:hypothetical protein [Nocardia brasiliensis]|uniref:hypothetical protein n=1 Tax=Nocardia brasiliensis TaxID=37326 RepID=UPI0024545648|nr:hypothetical protein [Nocardia brasiliensis]